MKSILRNIFCMLQYRTSQHSLLLQILHYPRSRYVIFKAKTGLESGLTYLCEALDESLGDAGGKRSNELKGGWAAMFVYSYWLANSPDTSASSAVAMGNQAAASWRPVYHWIHCTRRHLCFSPSLFASLSLLLALCQAPVHQSGDPGREQRARDEPTRAGTNSERAHERAQVQVSNSKSQMCPSGLANTAHTDIRHTHGSVRVLFAFCIRK